MTRRPSNSVPNGRLGFPCRGFVFQNSCPTTEGERLGFLKDFVGNKENLNLMKVKKTTIEGLGDKRTNKRFFHVWVLYITLLYPGEAAAATITDLQEVKALKAIREKMRNGKWDFSEDPCSGKGSWNVSQDLETQNKLVCEMHRTEGRSFFHVTRMYLKSQNLTGVVPAELANLTYLEEMCATNILCNFLGFTKHPLQVPDFFKTLEVTWHESSGYIPKELGNLTNLKKMDLFSNELYGLLPQSFVNLTQLKMLYIESNQLRGEIPQIYGHFQGLEHFVASSNSFSDGSNLSFMQNLTKLRTIVLRNASINGEIPKYLGDSIKPKILDLSYNYFSGELNSSWITNKEQINLIENSFNNNLSNGRDQAYLQRGFTCRAPQYTSLAINCGGNPWRTYKGDTNPLGPSSFLSSNGKWVVSNTGHFMDAEDNKWIVTGNISEFAKGINTDVYGIARCASTSLRYYALCVQNGEYNVQLHFAEIVISNGTTFASLGRRVFDVYIQGSRRLKDFNIKDGTYDIPVKGTYGPLVSAIKISPNFEMNSTRNSRDKSNKIMIICIVSGAVTSLGVVVCLSFIFIRKRKRTRRRSLAANDDTGIENSVTHYPLVPHFILQYNIVKLSTTALTQVCLNAVYRIDKYGHNFKSFSLEGILPDGKMVAVKQMFPKARQGIRDFLNQVGTISAVQHPNLVEFYGFCVEGKQLLLVYEYMENNSLARCLYGPQECRLNLDWPRRYNICLGVAHGLAYLHEGSRLRIIHRDIKTMNILLDQHLNPKISDFGLAKGYMAPEYALKGRLTEKADVYNFGVVVLEVVSGRSRIDKKLREEMVYLLEWTWHLYEKKILLDLLDVNVKNSGYSKEGVLRVINVGLLCTYESPSQRPSMSTVIGILEGKIEAPVSHSRP
ncbi:hypothetical protein SUGI_0122970 [Cryptomeria japonica]|nr:hypothetical protein SUGI_0122970 [Cryptomeria japonica]